MSRHQREHRPPNTQAVSVGRMTSATRNVVILAAVAIAVAFAVAGRSRDRATESPAKPEAALASVHAPAAAGMPRLVDVGADRCIPCKAMAPILASLRVEYAGRFEVVFIDVWKDPDAGQPYRVYMIPTQIFFDGAGRELDRHQGFISREDILATWQRLGFNFDAPATPPQG